MIGRALPLLAISLATCCALCGDRRAAARDRLARRGILVIPPAGDTRGSKCPGQRDGMHARRSLHRVPARRARSFALGRGRSVDALAPCQLRPDRPAADARGDRGVPRRRTSRCLRAADRSAAGVARVSASGGGGTGSTRPATRTSPAATTTPAIIKLSEGKWKYRDYVVRSFNDDKPYERFVVEQLAGDELVDWRSAESFTPEMRRAARRHRLSAQRGRRHRRKGADHARHSARRLAADRRGGGQQPAGADAGLRQVPRPQVRADPAARLLPADGGLYAHVQSAVMGASRRIGRWPTFRRPKRPRPSGTTPRSIARSPSSRRARPTSRSPIEARLLEPRSWPALPEPIRADVKAAIETEAAKRSAKCRSIWPTSSRHR